MVSTTLAVAGAMAVSNEPDPIIPYRLSDRLKNERTFYLVVALAVTVWGSMAYMLVR